MSRLMKKENESETPHIVVEDHNRNVINEAYRVVRTNLEFVVGKERASNVIMLTSANPGSGKTFITFNLATSLAIKGKRVIAIDLDLRKGSLSEYAGRPKAGSVVGVPISGVLMPPGLMARNMPGKASPSPTTTPRNVMR